ncbi:MAG: 1-acyl-sn-glycerol-3-phosphate acyltransferase [Clostridia bacterium]|nr:1-acyl-sn-glycerol-3-phosphate acyltransferase [Clostridia bacterium]
MKTKKPKKWVKKRHFLARLIIKTVFGLSIKFKYKAKIQKFKIEKGKQYLVIYNHQTGFDQFFVMLAFNRHLYQIASEDIFSLGFASRCIEFFGGPIPIKKQTNDIRAVMNALKVVKEGGSLALSPEGNRTFSGRTCYFKPSIVKMIKALKIPVAVLRIEDGYGVLPRWADDVRSGGMNVYVKRIIEPEEYLSLSDEDLHSLVSKELYVDESSPNKEFKHKNLAHYLERAIYYCPNCGFSVFESNKDLFECKKCKKVVRYLPNKQFEGVGFDFKYKNVLDWYDGQSEFINGVNLDEFTNEPVYKDQVLFSEVILFKRKRKIDKKAQVCLYGDKIVVKYKKGEMTFDLENAGAVTVLGRNKVNIYYGDKCYQIKGDKRMNGLKYVHFFHRYKNSHGGENNEFLGL